MRGRQPKPDALRQRRNKVSTAASLPTPEESKSNDVPGLPDIGKPWHARTIEWWASVWRSPMASEYLDADMQTGLFMLARLVQSSWEATETGELLKLASEIRLQSQPFGLSPIDRSRLRWSISVGEEAEAKTEQRRAAKAPKLPKSKDPRDVLKLA